MKFSITGKKKKRWSINTVGCLIEVTTWAGLNVLKIIRDVQFKIFFQVIPKRKKERKKVLFRVDTD